MENERGIKKQGRKIIVGKEILYIGTLEKFSYRNLANT
jgi:hypothetical protein